MDCRAAVLSCLAVLFILVLTQVEGRTKKVVIHVPYKVKKIKHVHTVYKTIHHHHAHAHHEHGHHEHAHHEHAHHEHDHDGVYLSSPTEEHEHFHHMHLHEEPGQHSAPVPGIGLPDFLPDVPLSLDMPDSPRALPPSRHLIPLFRRA